MYETLGHPGRDILLAASKANIGILSFTAYDVSTLPCPSCMESGIRKAPVNSVDQNAPLPLSLTHTDIAGPIEPSSQCHNRFVVVFIDDLTKLSAVCFLMERRQFKDSLVSYRALVKNEQAGRMYHIRFDQAAEYTSSAMARFTAESGISVEHSPPYVS